jgi:hypothetical protein
MRTKILVVLFALALLLSANLCAQVTIGGLTTPKAGALLDLNSTTPGGLVLSNVDLDDLSKIPANRFVSISAEQDRNTELAGMIVYNTYEPTGIGVHVWDGDDWIKPCAPPPPLPITFSGTLFCGTSTFTAKIDSVKGATSYVWSLPAGLTGSSNDTIIMITGDVGTYPAGSISVQAVSSCGGGTRRANMNEVVISEMPAAPTDPSSNAAKSGELVAFSATPAPGCTIDWYAAATGGSPISGKIGISSFTEALTATKTYYAESRNTTTGCVSASRLAVIGTLIIYERCISGTFDLTGKVDFVGAETQTNSGLIFSAPVRITETKTVFDGGGSDGSTNLFKADYRNHQSTSGTDDTGTFGSWFSWCMVKQYEDILCPGAWRVPTVNDFVNYSNAELADNTKPGMHGWLLGGSVTRNEISHRGSLGFYWSSNDTGNSDNGYAAVIRSSYFSTSSVEFRYRGLTLRCVKD